MVAGPLGALLAHDWSRTDFSVYTAAAEAVVHRTDIYAARNPRGWAYVYPPPFAIAIVPLALLPAFWGSMAWGLLSIVLLVSTARTCVALVRGSCSGRKGCELALLGMPALVLLPWWAQCLARGQADVLVAWLVVAAMRWLKEERDVAAGACLAGAAALKVFPLGLLGYLAWRRRWRCVAATLAGLAVLLLLLPSLVLGWRQNLAYLWEWTHMVAQPALASESGRAAAVLHQQLLSAAKIRDQSLEPVLWRLVGDPGARDLAGGLSLLMAAVVWRVGRRIRADGELSIAAAVIVWMLLAQPLAEAPYFVLLWLPVTVLVAATFTVEGRRRRWALRAVVAVFGVASVLSPFSRQLESWGSLCWGTTLLWGSLAWLAASASA